MLRAITDDNMQSAQSRLLDFSGASVIKRDELSFHKFMHTDAAGRPNCVELCHGQTQRPPPTRRAKIFTT